MLPSDQCMLNKDGTMTATTRTRPKEPFQNQDKILTSIVKNACGRGGLPISIVEQDWFRNFMKLVEPKLQSVSRVAVSS